MNSYLYRDTRRRRLADALDFLAVLEPTGAQLMLRSVIEIEQAALAADDWRVTDRTYLAVAVDWAWRNFMSIKELVDHDLVREASIFPAALTEAHGLAILNASLPHSPAGPPADYLDRVRAACEADQDETAFTELVHTAHSHWLNTGGEEPAYPFDDVGVLLPLRLETLFDEPATRFNDSPTQWKLSLRVTPGRSLDLPRQCPRERGRGQGAHRILAGGQTAGRPARELAGRRRRRHCLAATGRPRHPRSRGLAGVDHRAADGRRRGDAGAPCRHAGLRPSPTVWAACRRSCASLP